MLACLRKRVAPWHGRHPLQALQRRMSFRRSLRLCRQPLPCRPRALRCRVAWCMPAGLTGLSAIVPFFYCLYFATLLIHRERRDEHACRLKYGKDWDKYCGLVKYRIVPYIY